MVMSHGSLKDIDSTQITNASRRDKIINRVIKSRPSTSYISNKSRRSDNPDLVIKNNFAMKRVNRVIKQNKLNSTYRKLVCLSSSPNTNSQIFEVSDNAD